MSIAEMADFAVSVLAVFAGAIAFDMIGKYRIQLAYSSATPTPVPNRPKALTSTSTEAEARSPQAVR